MGDIAMLIRKATVTAAVAAGSMLWAAGGATAQPGDLDCADFSSQAEAQAEFESAPGDRHRLDADDDNIACEALNSDDGTEGTPAPGDTDVPDEQDTRDPGAAPDTAAGAADAADGQVGEMPAGAVETGDGSATGGGVPAVPMMLSVAGVGAAAAVTVVVRRTGRVD
ncbi:excalibur calcium-binding domain-containing protein [Saccharomonospora halophila]|uniref:excalibur calcium-binding domain-containing protein n=1 Tax=Saccharomonospora halophila TaxID=129922 RepID=UPI000380B790|nr:excalibur calcium-binding domain-containing protein [Saccharomonospora halophila]